MKWEWTRATCATATAAAAWAQRRHKSQHMINVDGRAWLEEDVLDGAATTAAPAAAEGFNWSSKLLQRIRRQINATKLYIKRAKI